MLVFAQVSSTNTKRDGSSDAWNRCQRSRRRATSARSCSLGRRLFFEAEALVHTELPHRPVTQRATPRSASSPASATAAVRVGGCIDPGPAASPRSPASTATRRTPPIGRAAALPVCQRKPLRATSPRWRRSRQNQRRDGSAASPVNNRLPCNPGRGRSSGSTSGLPIAAGLHSSQHLESENRPRRAP